MKSAICLLIFLSLTAIGHAQNWSTPVTIFSNGNNLNLNCTVDNNGTIHCVWEHEISDNFRQIYYSNSVDEGATWSTPVQISSNTKYWICSPHIVADTLRNLYVSYDYNVGNEGQTMVYYRKYDALTAVWSKQILVSENMPGANHNHLTIDNNNRLYFFWYYGAENGHFFYRVLENDQFGDIVDPYAWSQDTYFLVKAVADINNKLHCIGLHHGSNQTVYKERAVYFNCFNGEWSDYSELSTTPSWWKSDICLKNGGFPACTWNQIMNDDTVPIIDTFFSESEDGSFPSPEYLGNTTYGYSEPSLVIDVNDNPHIVRTEKNDSSFQIVHFYKTGGGEWIKNIVDQSDRTFYYHRLLSKGSSLYWIYMKALSYTTISIVYRKLDIIPTVNEKSLSPDIKIAPNPFNEQFELTCNNILSKHISIRIFDVYGRMVYKTSIDNIQNGQLDFRWESANNKGNLLLPGIYVLQILDGTKVYCAKIIKIIS